MARLVLFHLLEDPAAALILARQCLQMLIEVAFNLALGFGHEPETHSVAERTRKSADGEGSSVPERVEQTRTAVEFAQALLAPGEVIAFFFGSVAQRLAYFCLARGQRLTLIQRLRRDLTCMVDSHESGSVAPLGFIERRIEGLPGRIGA